MKAAVYIRVSTEEQALEGYSIEAQKKRGIEYCSKMGYDLVGFYVDEGISGKSLDRPKVQDLISDAKKKLFDVVVVYKLDRFTRSLKDLANILELFDKFGVVLKSTSEDIDVSSLSGRAMVQMLGVFAEFERGTIAERTAMGIEQRMREGFYKAPRAPFGYIYDKKTKNYYIDPSKAEIVKEIFELHQNGKGVDAICKIMNQRGIKTSYNSEFHRTFVKRMFTNGWYYCGRMQFTTRSGETLNIKAKNIPEPILTEEVFKRSNKLYGAKANNTRKRWNDEFYTFKGILRCEYCKTLMTPNTSAYRKNKNETDQVYRYYRCNRKREGRCINKYWLSSKLDQEFQSFLNEFAKNDYSITLEFVKKNIDALKIQIEHHQSEIKKNNERKNKLQFYLLDEVINKNDYLKNIETINTEINKHNNSIKELEAEIVELNNIETMHESKEIAINILNIWNELDYKKKKELMNILVKNIYVDRNGITKMEFIL